MFGEYALYVGDRVVALVADDQLFVKNTNAAAKVSTSCGLAIAIMGGSKVQFREKRTGAGTV